MTYVDRVKCSSSGFQWSAAACRELSIFVSRSSHAHYSGESVGENSKLTTTVSTLGIVGRDRR